MEPFFKDYESRTAYFLEILCSGDDTLKLHGRFRTEADALEALKDTREKLRRRDNDTWEAIISKGYSTYTNTDVHAEILYRIKIEGTQEGDQKSEKFSA